MLNPASVFFLSVYTESLYSLFYLLGMLSILLLITYSHTALTSSSESSRKKKKTSSFLPFLLFSLSLLSFVLSTLIRSNGIFNLIPYILLSSIAFLRSRTQLVAILSFVVFASVQGCLMLFPWVWHQASLFLSHCPYPQEQKENDSPFSLSTLFSFLSSFPLTLPTTRSFDVSFCALSESSPLPFLNVYSHIQHTYWQVGLFSQYQLKQLPNFALAFLPVSILLLAVFYHLKHHLWPTWKYDLNTRLSKKDRKNGISFLSFLYHYATSFFMQRSHISNSWMFYQLLSILSFHSFVLIAITLFIAHPQITNRLLLSSSPLLFIWFSTDVLFQPTKQEGTKRKGKEKTSILFFTSPFTYPASLRSFVMFYWVGYFSVGLLLHTNFFPWT